MNERHLHWAILLLRVSLGVVFVAHGLLKLLVFNLSGTAEFFAAQGFPAWSAYPVTFAEIIGGVLLIGGIATRWVCYLFIPILMGAIYVHIGNGWVFSSTNGGWEFPLFLLVVTIAQALIGPGRYVLPIMNREPESSAI